MKWVVIDEAASDAVVSDPEALLQLVRDMIEETK